MPLNKETKPNQYLRGGVESNETDLFFRLVTLIENELNNVDYAHM